MGNGMNVDGFSTLEQLGGEAEFWGDFIEFWTVSDP
jgi:hypothetical protein